ncbi:MAG: nucleotidyltransferase substrate binding protein [Chlamydiae bacterium]|nr:nucleotidyltransferase substrate binding protein [Chlamydiota bacterium]
MFTMKNVRWKQRFCNFEKVFLQLERAIQILKPSEVERAGPIQFFELAFELSWKTLKDYLEAEGYQEVKTPRETFKQAFQIDLIDSGHSWIDALEDQNLTMHTYDESTSLKIEKLIREKYYPLLKEFFCDFKQKK